MFELPSSKEKSFDVTREYAESKISKSGLERLKAVS
jgi:ATP-dependent Clp protease ATP-binding subunit ClpX